ncbi:hypothetical protein RA271_27670, partial [Pseudomonas syringae pv. tagetis]
MGVVVGFGCFVSFWGLVVVGGVVVGVVGVLVVFVWWGVVVWLFGCLVFVAVLVVVSGQVGFVVPLRVMVRVSDLFPG